ncbi:MAG: hypothetical protein WAK48_19410 [Candidatus Acidiferrum sp.]|jgi:hypothetical protein
MKLVVPTAVAALLSLVLGLPSALAQSASYPSDEEITLLVGQIDRAMTQ